MSYNIRYDNPDDKENWWENRKEAVVELINYYHPDFLGIQEGLHHQVAYLEKNTSNYRYIGAGRDDGKTKGEYAAIFYDSTKYYFLGYQDFWLSETPEKPSVGWDASMERICTFGIFVNKKTKEVIEVYNAHFDHIGEEARKRSAELILKKIEENSSANGKLIVMGDFNCGPSSEPISTFKSILDLTPTEKIYGPTGTFNGFDKMSVLENRIDYIFTKNLEIIKYAHVDDRRKNNLWVSDHLPVLAEIKN